MSSPADFNGAPLLAVIYTLLTITYISISLRCYVRLHITKAFQIDDWLIVLSQAIFTIFCAFLLVGIHNGIGRHNDSLAEEAEIEALKYQTLATICYVANMMFIKLSIAIFLLRIAVKPTYIWILRISMVIIGIWSTAIFLFEVFQCSPVQAQWDFRIKNAKCPPQTSFVAAAYSISVMTVLSDWLYALIPIPMLWSVQMTRQAKATVAFILSLGVFASIATLIRLKFLVDLASLDDVLYNGTNAMIWTAAEPGLAIIAASLITIRPLLRAFNLRGFQKSSYPSSSRQKPQPLSLRSDLHAMHSTANTISGPSVELNKLSPRDKWMGRTTQREVPTGDGSSEEYMIEGAGITKTMDVKIVHGHSSERRIS